MSETRRLRVTCNGPYGKSLGVTDAETGKPFPAVSVAFEAGVHDVPRLTVTTYFADADVEADARVVRLCPGCGRERGALTTLKFRWNEEKWTETRTVELPNVHPDDVPALEYALSILDGHSGLIHDKGSMADALIRVLGRTRPEGNP